MNGGEKPGRREQMDRFVKQMVKSGHDRKYIKSKAIELAVKKDKQTKRG